MENHKDKKEKVNNFINPNIKLNTNTNTIKSTSVKGDFINEKRSDSNNGKKSGLPPMSINKYKK